MNHLAGGLALIVLLAGGLGACGSKGPEVPSPPPNATDTQPAQPAQATPPVPATQLPQAPQAKEDDELGRLAFSNSDWKTDFRKRSVPLKEIFSGGPPKDGIPAIDRPRFITVPEADRWLDDREPVQIVEIKRDARAYPLQVLIWHEIVNDVVGGSPLVITYCPLCNTGIVFDAALPDGTRLTFGTTGNLRFSDLVMYDRQTESWWQQATGEAIVGELVGSRLRLVSSSVVSWAEFKKEKPAGRILSRETGHTRPYGQNPYLGYDTGTPFLYRGPSDLRLPAMERVVAIEIGAASLAVPYSVLREQPVVHHTLAGQDLVVFYRKGTASALDSEDIREGRDVGSATVFDPHLDGMKLIFRMEGDNIVDDRTGSVWSLLGRAESGPLAGRELQPIASRPGQFWFSWVVFKPDTVVYTP